MNIMSPCLLLFASLSVCVCVTHCGRAPPVAVSTLQGEDAETGIPEEEERAAVPV